MCRKAKVDPEWAVTNLKELQDAIIKECFQNIVESMPRRIKGFLIAKVVQPSKKRNL